MAVSRSHESFPALLFPLSWLQFDIFGSLEEETQDLKSTIRCTVAVCVCVSCWTQGVNVQSEQLQESERCSGPTMQTVL